MKDRLGSKTKGQLSQSLDRKVTFHIEQYLNHQQPSPEESSHNSRLLSVPQILRYMQSAEPALRRFKQTQLEKSIERSLSNIKEREEVERQLEGDNASEQVDEESLMEVQHHDANSVNRRIVDVWRQAANSGVSNNPSSISEAAIAASSVTKGGTTSINGSNGEISARPANDRKQGEQQKEPTECGISGLSSPRKRERSNYSKEAGVKRPKNERNNARIATRDVTLADIGGVEDVVDDLLELISMPLMHPEVYTYTGIDMPRGVLLHGPPGCGKTMLANALAAELGVPFISISAPSIVSGMSGESEKKVRDLFDEAKQMAPCLIFLDEIDAITPKRESAQREMEKRIVAQILTCMDDLSARKTDGKPVLVIGATNRPDSLDPALRRAGRFDREICMNVPDELGREKILKVLCQKLRLAGDFDFHQLAKMTPGFVGADLNALITTAGFIAIKRIFKLLQTNAVTAAVSLAPGNGQGEEDSQMELEVPQAKLTTAISIFKERFPAPFKKEELEPLSITLADFIAAVPKVQPSSKREGFATVPDITWKDIGALHNARLELEMCIVQPILQPEKYKSVGIVAPMGVLLWGPPGCGKTLLAKAVANESRANFISVKGPELLNKYVGESERAVRQLFTRARASPPCVIFFDELDALVPRRDDSLSDASSRVVNTLLTELDGLNDRKGVFVIGATNRPDIIDPAMLRPGRFDRPLFVELPTPAERVEILKKLTSKTPLDDILDLVGIAESERCKNFSGADLQSLVREAATSALRRSFLKEQLASVNIDASEGAGMNNSDKVIVTMEDFENGLGKVQPSVTAYEREKYKTIAKKFGSATTG